MRIAALLSIWLASNMFGQGLDPGALLKLPRDTWPTYNGDYSGRRYSPLNQIDTSNINSLTLAWAYPAHSVSIKSTPLLVDGILYFTVPDNVWAIDAVKAPLRLGRIRPGKDTADTLPRVAGRIVRFAIIRSEYPVWRADGAAFGRPQQGQRRIRHAT